MTSDQAYEAVKQREEGFPTSFQNKSKRGNRRSGSCFYTCFYHRQNRYLASCCIFFIIWGIYTGGAGTFLGSPKVIVDATVGARSEAGMLAMAKKGRKLAVTSWNIAAINNNPFEYWITFPENPQYATIMGNIERFLEETTAEEDVPVHQVFTDDMFSRLESKMTSVANWPSIRSFWENDFKNRKIVSEFMKDKELGNKRLASMPDRVTNTINVNGLPDPVCRPTVINMYDGDLSSMDQWYNSWESFMFDTQVPISTKIGEVQMTPYEMLKPIKKAKYPAITEIEEKVSLPLQTMCGAIFDAILVHMMNTVSTPDTWQPLKRTIVEKLNKLKTPRTIEILQTVYSDSDIITLQEVSSSFIKDARNGPLGTNFWIIAPADLDATRDQNSVIMLNRNTFPFGSKIEITDLIGRSFPAGTEVPVAKGDINAITADDVDGIPFVIISFHGDTNGLATIPVLKAVKKAIHSEPTLAAHKIIFGLDANTYEHAKKGKQQDVMEWGKTYVKHGLTSCWGDVPQKGNYTTFNARTYLQPQLNKACKEADKRKNGDVNPKDFILFAKGDFNVVQTAKDNTGLKEYVEDMAFPTLTFPSDHGILSTILEPITTDNEK